MGQSVSINSGTAAGALVYTVGGNGVSAVAGQGNGQSFDQKLVSMLLGNAGLGTGQANAQLLNLAGLQSGGSTQEENANDSLLSMIEGLLQQLPKLDDALEDNPSLLEALQGWLQSFQSLIMPQAEKSGGDGNAEILVLAQQPETVRFAVQDALVQLLTAQADAQQVAGPSNVTAPPQIQALLDSLQNVLDSVPDSSEPAQTGGKTAELPSVHNLVSGNKPAETNSQGNMGQHGNDGSLKGENPQAAAVSQPKAESGKSQFSVAAGVAGAAGEISVVEAEPTDNADVDSSLQPGSVVTAGQLALRDAGVAAVKHTPRPVPVENFAKEMSGFLVNKLEIVKLQGVSEARISLYPEHLGQVDVKITMQGGQLTAQFMTEHAFAKESLEQQMSQLRSALQSQGLQVNKLEVTQNTALSSHMYHDGQQSGSGAGQQQQSEKRRTLVEEDALATRDLNEEWNAWVAEVREKEQGFGSSFSARA
ncbi:flagellar hook-length control protein FliK [Paenibacillus macerans]|uniref:flagellar hook-length control protein FliK n=1 Tax=Paenibacillus macerans TaxID=44252 RepID=UPI002DB59BC2|nr:flagellar hook-length control protein FliK [Paenibacillus macerans]MEC0332992.1 flagellar hook-length control protein FliK [Paenibacillus macerans]